MPRFRYCKWTKQRHIRSLNKQALRMAQPWPQRCVVCFCVALDNLIMALNTPKQYFCVHQCTQPVCYSGWLLLQFSLYHSCPSGTFQGKQSWKLNPYPSDLILFGDVETAVFNYHCLKPSSVVARFWRNESGQRRIMPQKPWSVGKDRCPLSPFWAQEPLEVFLMLCN